MGTYVLGARRWVPVMRSAVSDDGGRYAYAESHGFGATATSTVHVVDIGSGSDRAVNLNQAYLVLNFAADGVYLGHIVPASDAPLTGLALLDPGSGAVAEVAGDRNPWSLVGGGFAWATDLDRSDPSPPQGLGAANRVLRLDLKTKAATTWFTSPGHRVSMLGLDLFGTPVLAVADTTTYAVRVGNATVYNAAFGNDNPTGPLVSDTHGLWFGSPSGQVWLLPPGGTLKQLASTPTRPAIPAGSCA